MSSSEKSSSEIDSLRNQIKCGNPKMIIREKFIEIQCEDDCHGSKRAYRFINKECDNSNTTEMIRGAFFKWCSYYEAKRKHEYFCFLTETQRMAKQKEYPTTDMQPGQIAYKILKSKIQRASRHKPPQEGCRLAIVCTQQCYGVLQTKSFSRTTRINTGMDILLNNNVRRKPFSLLELATLQLAKYRHLSLYSEAILVMLLLNDTVANSNFYTGSFYSFHRLSMKYLLHEALIRKRMNGILQPPCFLKDINFRKSLTLSCSCQYGFRSHDHLLTKDQENDI